MKGLIIRYPKCFMFSCSKEILRKKMNEKPNRNRFFLISLRKNVQLQSKKESMFARYRLRFCSDIEWPFIKKVFTCKKCNLHVLKCLEIVLHQTWNLGTLGERYFGYLCKWKNGGSMFLLETPQEKVFIVARYFC